MASFDGMTTADPAAPSSGGIFQLSRASSASGVEALGDGRYVEVKEGCPFVVIRGCDATDHKSALIGALSSVQQGLDLLSIQGLADLSTTNVEQWHIVWWPETIGIALRFTEVSTFGTIMTATLTVRDSQGNVIPDPPKPPTAWDESYRYFRLAQVTDDLFDAFRNLYLALESILYSIEPMQLHPNGKPAEGEKTWFKRALTAANLPNLVDYAPPGSINPIDDIFADLYRDRRTALFHAKPNRPHLRPHDPADREYVEASHKRLTKLYLALVATHLGLRRRSGGVTEHGFQLMTQPFDAGVEILATDEPLAEAAMVPAIRAGRYLALPTRRAAELDRPLFKSVFASAPTASLAALPHVSQVVLASNTGIPLLGSNLGAQLTLDGINRFEVHLPVRMTQPEQPRELYST